MPRNTCYTRSIITSIFIIFKFPPQKALQAGLIFLFRAGKLSTRNLIISSEENNERRRKNFQRNPFQSRRSGTESNQTAFPQIKRGIQQNRRRRCRNPRGTRQTDARGIRRRQLHAGPGIFSLRQAHEDRQALFL